jgi:hypothetical protein
MVGGGVRFESGRGLHNPSGERDLAEIDRDDERLSERLVVGSAREDPVLGRKLDARDLVVVET